MSSGTQAPSEPFDPYLSLRGFEAGGEGDLGVT